MISKTLEGVVGILLVGPNLKKIVSSLNTLVSLENNLLTWLE